MKKKKKFNMEEMSEEELQNVKDNIKMLMANFAFCKNAINKICTDVLFVNNNFTTACTILKAYKFIDYENSAAVQKMLSSSLSDLSMSQIRMISIIEDLDKIYKEFGENFFLEMAMQETETESASATAISMSKGEGKEYRSVPKSKILGSEQNPFFINGITYIDQKLREEENASDKESTDKETRRDDSTDTKEEGKTKKDSNGTSETDTTHTESTTETEPKESPPPKTRKRKSKEKEDDSKDSSEDTQN
jgi:hypothetical protein